MSEKPESVERIVRERYSEAAGARVESLCCPVSYDTSLLAAIPAEIIERDYGCGDPSRHLRPGETVLDLGSGGGKICYIASQVVGRDGSVIGVDVNEEMLALAESHRQAVGDAIGYHNVSFRKGRIQDLALDLRALDARLAAEPVSSVEALERVEEWVACQRRERPLIADESIDAVVSNCVLNLVRADQKRHLFGEIARVLRPGGRAVISDIVSDRAVPAAMQADPELWSGCISGAMPEEAFADAFRAVGLSHVEVVARGEEPWQVVDGIEFRSLTVQASRSTQSCC